MGVFAFFLQEDRNMKLKKYMIVLFSILCVFQNSVFAYGADNNDISEYEEVILAYYSYVNQSNIVSAINLYCDELYDEVTPFFENENNKIEKQGLYNIHTVSNIEIFFDSSVGDYSYDEKIYHDTKKYLIKCCMDVEQTNKYYKNGVNYYEIYVGKDHLDECKILYIGNPKYSLISKYDSSEDADGYIRLQNMLVYGTVSLDGTDSNGSACFSTRATTNESPILVDYVGNPANIRVLLSDGTIVVRDLKEYCKTVAAGEITVITDYELMKAHAVAIRMFAIYHILENCNGTGSDIKWNDQRFDESLTHNPFNDQAIEDTYNYFLLDEYGGMVKTFYRKDRNSQQGEYCKKNGGIMPQIETDYDRNNRNNGWQNILHYYYERVPGVDYYNVEVTYGLLIITTGHIHDWSSGEYCNICNAWAH